MVRKEYTESSKDIIKILILCEDKKSFRVYIEKICNKLGYKGSLKNYFYNKKGNYNIYIKKAKNTDPLGIVKQAKEELERKNYDIVYCVFDKDGHVNGRLDNYNKAMNNKTKNLIKINSVPCSETFLLLHFKETTKLFKNPDELIKYLEKEIRKIPRYKNFKYDKAKLFDEKMKNSSKESFLDFLFSRMEIAKKNVKQLDKVNKQTDSDNPSTKIPKLIEDLEKWVDE